MCPWWVNITNLITVAHFPHRKRHSEEVSPFGLESEGAVLSASSLVRKGVCAVPGKAALSSGLSIETSQRVEYDRGSVCCVSLALNVS